MKLESNHYIRGDSQELLDINGIELRVNPQSIQVIEKRNVDTYSQIRGEKTYATASKFAKNRVGITLHFDITNDVDLENLIRITTMVDMYPFVFIKSPKLQRYMHVPYGDIFNYQIFGVSRYSIITNSELQNVYFLDLTLEFFNHVPFAKKLFFFSPSVQKNSNINAATGATEEQSKRIKAQSISIKDSELFYLFFEDEINKRMQDALSSISGKGLGFFGVKVPTIKEQKPNDTTDYEEMSTVDYSDEENQLTSLEFKDSTAVPGLKQKKAYMRWDYIGNPSFENSPNINQGYSVVRSISITRFNNLASISMTGWKHPVLQYMGKGHTEVHVEFNNRSEPDGLDAMSTVKYALQQLDANFASARVFGHLNVLKIDTLATIILPLFGVVPDQEQTTALSENQGADSFILNMVESDPREHIASRQYNDAAGGGFDLPSIISDLRKANDYLSNRENISSNVLHSITNINYTLVRNAVFKIESRLWDDLKGYVDPSLKGKKTRRGTRNRVSDSGYSKTQRISELLNIYDSIKDSKEKGDYLRYKRVLENSYITISNLASQGNTIASSLVTTSPESISKEIINLEDKFRTLGVSDINLGNPKLLEYLSEFGVTDPRTIPPFFFLGNEVYHHIKTVSSSIGRVVAGLNSVSKTILDNETSIAREDLKDSAIVAFKEGVTPDGKKESDFSKVQPDGPFNKGNKPEPDEIAGLQHGLEPAIDQDIEGNSIDVFSIGDIVKQQATSVSSYFQHGMNLAYPCLKVYLVEDNKSDFSSKLDKANRYFELTGIMDAHLSTNNDENPVDVFVMSVINPGNIYTDAHVLRDKFKSKKSGSNSPTPAYDQIIVKPGNRLHIKAGYGNNVNAMETIFNGVITEVSGEYKLDIVAEGFGRELVLFKHGDDPNEDNSFFMNANTKSILANALNSKEIEHFGRFDLLEPDPEAKALRTFASGGIFNFLKYSDKYLNIWVDAITDIDPEYNGALISNFFAFLNPSRTMLYKYPIYQLTPWDILKEMEYRHPGSYSKPVIYGDSMSYFFGIREQLYIYRSLDPRLYDKRSLLSAASGNPLTLAIALSPVGAAFSFGDLAKRATDHLFSSNGVTLYERLRSARFKPVSDMHLATTENNIISNEIKVTDNFNTVVNVQFYNDEHQEYRDFKNNTLEMKIDDNLAPSAHRQMDLAMPGIHEKPSAMRYGAVQLRKEAEKMYDGRLVLIGNPRIKAGDFISIIDNIRDMRGVIKVRECTHHWSLTQGFYTVVTPGLYADESYIDFPLKKIFLGIYSGLEIAHMFEADIALNNYLSDDGLILNKVMQDINVANVSKIFNQETKGMNVSDYVFGASVGLLGTSLSYSSYLQLASKIGLATSSNAGEALGGEARRLFGDLKRLGKDGLPNLIKDIKNAKVALNTPSTFGVIGSVTKNGTALGQVFRLGRIAQVGLFVGRFFLGPIGIGLAVFDFIFTMVEDSAKARQPLRIYPLKQNGTPYVAGIYGFKEQGYLESVGEKFTQFGDDIETIINSMSAAITSARDE